MKELLTHGIQSNNKERLNTGSNVYTLC